eukprot:Sspe_Gene.2362::Locus_779_Transcript_1_3_Confidence_0.600_Length_2117::g.2362::m.2362
MPDDGYGFFQVLFHGLVYAYILFNASNMISEGSELLLLTPMKGLVGSVVLPVLGAVPDGAIILFSGSTQSKLSVGVGALAGSTIMLLTVPWFLAMTAGRVDVVDQTDPDDETRRRPLPRYAGKPDERLTADVPLRDQLHTTGVSVDSSIKRGGWMMLITAVSYIIIQGPAFGLACGKEGCGCEKSGELVPAAIHSPGDSAPLDSDIIYTGPADEDSCIRNKVHKEKPWALAGMLISIAFFLFYLFDQWRCSKKDDGGKMARKAEEVGRKAIKKGLSVDFRVFLQLDAGGCCGKNIELEDILKDEKAKTEFHRAVEKQFHKYNRVKAARGEVEKIDSMEIGQLLADLRMTGTPLWHTLKCESERGALTLPRFKEICWDYIRNTESPAPTPSRKQPNERALPVQAMDETDEDEELEVPEDMEGLDLSEPAQQRRIWKRSLTMMLSGTLTVIFFSDPMCDILSNLGSRLHIPAFYVAFVLAPLASNASELLAAYSYAAKKTRKTMTISLSSLLGAACMNNTFCLAIFLLQIVNSKVLIWEFSAETITIIAVEIVMFVVSQRQHPRWILSFAVLSLLPVSIALVAGLEAAGLD